MYNQDDINLRKAYQQVNEVFGKNYLGLLGNKMLSKFSATAEENVRLIRYANKWADQMKRDAAASGLSYSKLSPDWVDAWFDKRFDFYPSDYNETYETGENLSDFIRRALSTKQQKDMLSKLEAKKSSRAAEKEAAARKPLKDVQQNVVGLDALKASEKQSQKSTQSPSITLSDKDTDFFSSFNADGGFDMDKGVPIPSEIEDPEERLKELRKEREELEKANPGK
jgi:hypothetical protein